MPVPFPSEAWINALKDQLNNSAAYAEVAKNWEGDINFRIELPDGAVAVLYLDLWHGKCREAYQVTPGRESPRAAFALSAPVANFVRILKGQLDPMQAMMTGKLKVQGNMVSLMKNIPTVLEFVRNCQQIDSAFPEARAT
jgi:putative sterol carrier protein